MTRQELTGQRAVAIFLMAAVALSPIFLAIFSKPVLLFGLPQLYLYIFTVWGGVVLAIGINVFRIKSDEGEPRPRAPEFSVSGQVVSTDKGP